MSKNAYEAAVEVVTRELAKRYTAAVEKAAATNKEQRAARAEADRKAEEDFAAERMKVQEVRNASAAEKKNQTEEEKATEQKAWAEEDAAARTAFTKAQKKLRKKTLELEAAPECVPLTQLESITACRESYAQLAKPTIFLSFPATIVKVMTPKYSDDPNDLSNHFSRLYIVSFSAKAANPDDTGCDTIDVTAELGDEHIATCLAYLPWDKIERVDQYLTKPLSKMLGDANYQWTKVEPEFVKGVQFVEIKNSAVTVKLNKEAINVPVVDFKSAPQVQVRKLNTNKCFDSSGEKSGDDLFFVHKAAVKAALTLAAQVAKGEISPSDMAKVECNERMMDQLSKEYQDRKGKKNPAYNLSQYSARPFVLLSYDTDLQMACLEVDLDVISVPLGGAAAPRSKVMAADEDEREDALYATFIARHVNTLLTYCAAYILHFSPCRFLGKGKTLVTVHVDQLASALYRIDNKWTKFHPYQDKETGALYVFIF